MALKNPNGYGSVVKLSGKRRRPYAVRKTVGYDDRGYPIYSIIGYYETRTEAMLALADYNSNPYDIDLSKVSFKELYELWSKENYPKMKSNAIRIYKAAYKHSKTLYDLQYTSIRKLHFQRCIDACQRGVATKDNMKLLYTQLDKFAYDQDIIKKGYSKNLVTGEMKHHQYLYAVQHGIAAFDAGHFPTEDVVIAPLREQFSARFPEADFIISQASVCPYRAV